MATCPHCKKQLIIPERAKLNMLNYQTSCRIAASCCGRPVLASPVTVFEVSESFTDSLEDDWGTPYKTQPVNIGMSVRRRVNKEKLGIVQDLSTSENGVLEAKVASGTGEVNFYKITSIEVDT